MRLSGKAKVLSVILAGVYALGCLFTYFSGLMCSPNHSSTISSTIVKEEKEQGRDIAFAEMGYYGSENDDLSFTFSDRQFELENTFGQFMTVGGDIFSYCCITADQDDAYFRIQVDGEFSSLAIIAPVRYKYFDEDVGRMGLSLNLFDGLNYTYKSYGGFLSPSLMDKVELAAGKEGSPYTCPAQWKMFKDDVAYEYPSYPIFGSVEGETAEILEERYGPFFFCNNFSLRRYFGCNEIHFVLHDNYISDYSCVSSIHGFISDAPGGYVTDERYYTYDGSGYTQDATQGALSDLANYQEGIGFKIGIVSLSALSVMSLVAAIAMTSVLTRAFREMPEADQTQKKRLCYLISVYELAFLLLFGLVCCFLGPTTVLGPAVMPLNEVVGPVLFAYAVVSAVGPVLFVKSGFKRFWGYGFSAKAIRI